MNSTPPPAPTYVLVPAAPSRRRSVMALTLGIVSLVAGFTIVIPVAGLILGIGGPRHEPAGRGIALAGTILNALVLAALLLGVLLLGLSIAATLAAESGTGPL